MIALYASVVLDLLGSDEDINELNLKILFYQIELKADLRVLCFSNYLVEEVLPSFLYFGIPDKGIEFYRLHGQPDLFKSGN